MIEQVVAFTQQHPKASIDIIASDQYAEMVDERVDIALRYTDSPDENLIARRLMAIDTAICASPEYW
nr:LysR substrate-binding domain-containing protein [Vibrio ostreicida]